MEREKLISLVRGLQNGEPDAAAELFDTFRQDIYYFILKTVNNDHDLAEDLTQDTFLEIIEKIGDLKEPAAFVTWSKQIAYHKCTGYFRKRKELLVDENEDGFSVFDTVEEERDEFIPDAALDKEELKNTIIAMINDLPEDQKSAIILRYFNEISVKDIAAIQGVSEGTVKSRLNYGRKAIRQSVEDYERKNDIKLRCAGVVPLLLWLFRVYRIDNGVSVTSKTAVGTFMVAEESAAAAAGTSTASATATATAVKSAAVVGAKAAGKALATKVIAVLAATTVTIGSVAVGMNILNDSEETDPPHIQIQESWITDTTAWAETEENPAPAETEQSEPEKTTENPTIPSTQEPTVPPTAAPNETEPAPSATQPPYIETPTSTEPTDAATEPSGDAVTCEHNWGYGTWVTVDEITEIRNCLICHEHEILATYPNTCVHDFRQIPAENENGEIIYSYGCANCGAVP